MKLQRKGERYVIKTKRPALPSFLIPTAVYLDDLLNVKPGRIIRYGKS